jgi:hypothetical protein
VLKHAPYSVVPNVEQIRNGLHWHLSGQSDHEGVEHLTEAAATARPWNWDLPGLAARATGDTGSLGMNEGLVLEETQMFPAAGARVVDRLIGCAAGRTGEPSAWFETHFELDLFDL